MDAKQLAQVVRGYKKSVEEALECIKPGRPLCEDLLDAKDLFAVLANMIEGKTVSQSFGAPGDWGYNTPIGKALAAKEDGRR